MKSENVLMFVVLVGVLLVGISGLVLTNSGISGMVSVNQEYAYSISDFVDISLDSGTGTNTSFKATINPVHPFQNPTTFDTFGNCTGCTLNIDSSPEDPDYAGLIGNNHTLCFIVESGSNVPINISMQALSLLPPGWNDMRISSRSYRNLSSKGTIRYYFNNRSDAFDYSNSLSIGPSLRPVWSNWSDGSGFGQSVKESVSCYWSLDVYAVSTGTYSFGIYILGAY